MGRTDYESAQATVVSPCLEILPELNHTCIPASESILPSFTNLTTILSAKGSSIELIAFSSSDVNACTKKMQVDT